MYRHYPDPWFRVPRKLRVCSVFRMDVDGDTLGRPWSSRWPWRRTCGGGCVLTIARIPQCAVQRYAACYTPHKTPRPTAGVVGWWWVTPPWTVRRRRCPPDNPRAYAVPRARTPASRPGWGHSDRTGNRPRLSVSDAAWGPCEINPDRPQARNLLVERRIWCCVFDTN